jgi:hypothetical protein
MAINHQWPILAYKKPVDINAFINFWKSFYDSDRYYDSQYNDNLIPIAKMSDKNVRQLFEWKNGRDLSKSKNKSVETLIGLLPEIRRKLGSLGNEIHELEAIFKYGKAEIFKTGYIWNIFLLHILKPDICPIADRYVYEAWKKINSSNSNLKNNWQSYVIYMKFFNGIAVTTGRSNRKQRKEIDEALWGFGKYLSSPYAKLLIND